MKKKINKDTTVESNSWPYNSVCVCVCVCVLGASQVVLVVKNQMLGNETDVDIPHNGGI